jgi:hypothetical protein
MTSLISVFFSVTAASQVPGSYVSYEPYANSVQFSEGVLLYVGAIIVLVGVLLIGGALILNSSFARRKREGAFRRSDGEADADLISSEPPNTTAAKAPDFRGLPDSDSMEQEKERRKIA